MIKSENLYVSYPDKTKALNDLNFTIEKGECVAIVGSNGAGKSSLLLSLVGILLPEKGSITIDSVAVTKQNLDDLRKKVGLVFQNPDDQLFMSSIAEDIAFGPRNLGLKESEVASLVDDTLKRLGISYLKDRFPLKLSGGEKRMAAIGTVLAMEPSVMLFDEPSAFLDPRARRNLIHVMKELSHTKIIATHDLPLAVDLCERVLILKNGTLYATGRPSELLFDEKLMDDCGLEAIKRM